MDSLINPWEQTSDLWFAAILLVLNIIAICTLVNRVNIYKKTKKDCTNFSQRQMQDLEHFSAERGKQIQLLQKEIESVKSLIEQEKKNLSQPEPKESELNAEKE
ncbi:MAG: hypothetical protein II038_09835 [Lachnospiraceae bacterium]|nr:hypothetical protein [Lachnospiraceae bacterium]